MGPNRVIATYRTHEEAQHAIETLADRQIPVDRLAIVTEGVSYIQRLRKRAGTGASVLIGAILGGIVGGLIGLVLGLSLLTVPGFFIGALIGAFTGPVAQPEQSGPEVAREVRRDSRFDVVADREVADRARRVLQEAEQHP